MIPNTLLAVFSWRLIRTRRFVLNPRKAIAKQAGARQILASWKLNRAQVSQIISRINR
jgi:hypothetical protein